jgi:transcription factor IIIB 90 kDa subunit
VIRGSGGKEDCSWSHGWTLDDGRKKDMQLEDVVDIDIGYDAPPPSFTAGMKLMKKRRARIEAANKQLIDAIRKAPTAPAASTNHSQPGVRNEDARPPHKLAKKKREGKRIDDIDRIVLGDNLAEMAGRRGEKEVPVTVLIGKIALSSACYYMVQMKQR